MSVHEQALLGYVLPHDECLFVVELVLLDQGVVSLCQLAF